MQSDFLLSSSKYDGRPVEVRVPSLSGINISGANGTFYFADDLKHRYLCVVRIPSVTILTVLYRHERCVDCEWLDPIASSAAADVAAYQHRRRRSVSPCPFSIPRKPCRHFSTRPSSGQLSQHPFFLVASGHAWWPLHYLAPLASALIRAVHFSRGQEQPQRCDQRDIGVFEPLCTVSDDRIAVTAMFRWRHLRRFIRHGRGARGRGGRRLESRSLPYTVGIGLPRL